MRIIKCMIVFFMLILVFPTTIFAQDPRWPRQHVKDGNTLVIYQPQVDDWKNFAELDWRMAVSLTPKNGKPALGVAVLNAETQLDNDNKMVLITNIKFIETRFPSLDPENAARMDELLRTFMPQTVSITLQQLVACVPKKESVPGVQLKSDPPEIFVSYKPAILLDVDGKPVNAPIDNTNLEYIVNTHWSLFFDKQNSVFYLLVGDQWLTAASLQGPWSISKKLPKDMSKITKETRWAELKNVIPPPDVKPGTAVPTVFYSTKPAEVILFDGKPVYEGIPGTGLQFANNTISYVFLYTPTNQYYYLTAGRWFRADSLGGPWTFATPTLPGDFTNIPRNSPAAQVLASVPGTEEAKDAVLMAQIPTTVIVDPAAAAATAKVTYNGTPQFAPIEGTSLYYATNTQQKVIKVGDLYYLCLQGIWFVSTNPQGPWQTAQSVPQVIYTIPASSPVYNVTYVTQVTTSDGYVQSSYTSGYMGVFIMGVTTGVIIAGGTGYYYPPYVYYPVYGYPVYYPPPYTYGYVSHYHTATGAYGVSQTVYGPYGSATRAASYNPYTGTYARGASVSTEYGSASAARAYNPYTGASAATRQGSNAYASWGSSVVTKGGESAYSRHYSTDQGSVGTVKTSSGGRAAGVSTEYGSAAVGRTSSGDLYAGHDGNIYKNTGDGWQKYDDGGWTDIQTPSQSAQQQAQQRTQSAQQQAQTRSQSMKQQSSGASRESFQQQAQQRSSSFQSRGGSEQMQQLQQEAQNRQRGQQSSQRFQQFQGFSREGGSGRSFGGSRGGGGFRR